MRSKVQLYPDIVFPEVRPGRVSQSIPTLERHEIARASFREKLASKGGSSRQMYYNGQHMVPLLRGWTNEVMQEIYPTSAWPDNSRDLDFMKVKIDYTLVRNVPELSRLPSRYKYVPLLELTGSTRNGDSIWVNVWGALPYFYVSCDTLMLFPDWPEEELCETIRWHLETLLRKTMDQSAKRRDDSGMYSMLQAGSGRNYRYVHAVEVIRDHKSIYGATKVPRTFLKIILVRPKEVPTARGFFHLNGQFSSIETGLCSRHFESNFEFVCRQMVDANIAGAGWVTLPAGKYHMRGETIARLTESAIEVDAHFDDLIGRGKGDCGDPRWRANAPLLVNSIDYEVIHSIPGRFPIASAEGDWIVQMGMYTCWFQDGEYVLKHGCVFMVDPYPERRDSASMHYDPAHRCCKPVALGDDTPLSGFQPDVYLFPNEITMLNCWALYQRHIDADMFTGYNIVGFDFPYHLGRTRALRIESTANYFGRKLCHKAYLQKQTFSSQAFGITVKMWPVLSGALVEDAMDHVVKDFTLSLRSHTLKNVSKEVLKDQFNKRDVHWTRITPMFWGTDAEREELTIYVFVDAAIPVFVLATKTYIGGDISQARVSGVPMEFLRTKGQGAKTMANIIYTATPEGYMLPNLNNPDDRQFLGRKDKKDSNARESAYEGATVLKPKRGFYKDGVITLDFSSLYPSIMQAFGIGFSSWIPEALKPYYDEDEYAVAPTKEKDCFLKPEVFESVVAQLLRKVLAARSRDKKERNKHPWGSAAWKAYETRQVADKTVANSTYGFTGAKIGRCPLIPVGRSVTAYGRQLIEITRTTIEEYEGVTCMVIYGDTDSVMILILSTSDIQECIDIGKGMAAAVNAKLPNPVNLAFEKVFKPYLLFKKKRYAGLMWERADKPSKLMHKGTEAVRRDNFLLLNRTVKDAVDLLMGWDSKKQVLTTPDTQAAIDLIKETARNISMGDVPVEDLVISKKFSRRVEDYKTIQPHIELNKKIEARNKGSSYPLGSRIPFVYIKGIEEKITYRAEDPAYAIENDLPIDTTYYLNQFKRSLLRIMTPVLAPASDMKESALYDAVMSARGLEDVDGTAMHYDDQLEDDADDLVDDLTGDAQGLALTNDVCAARETDRKNRLISTGKAEKRAASVARLKALLDGNDELSEEDAIAKTARILFQGAHMYCRRLTIPNNSAIVQAMWGGDKEKMVEKGKTQKKRRIINPAAERRKRQAKNWKVVI